MNYDNELKCSAHAQQSMLQWQPCHAHSGGLVPEAQSGGRCRDYLA